jgi:eag0010
MKLTFSKTLLATAVMLGLTACSSGGGGGSNEPTTTPNNNQVVIPSNPSTTPKNNNLNTANSNKKNPSADQKNNNVNETINVPIVNNQTDNTTKEITWDVLPAIPKIETSKVSVYGAELKGKATYFYKGTIGYAEKISYEQPYNGTYYSESVSKHDGNSYIILNADFDNKKVNGSAAVNLYSTGAGMDKKRQVEITFKDTALFKGGDLLQFNGEAIGKTLSKDLKIEDLSGSYSGSVVSDGKEAYVSYNVYSPNQELKVQASGKILYQQ